MATKQIRIRVRTDELGNWVAWGAGAADGDEADLEACTNILDQQTADAGFGQQRQECWLTADVPIPEIKAIEGKVSQS